MSKMEDVMCYYCPNGDCENHELLDPDKCYACGWSDAKAEGTIEERKACIPSEDRLRRWFIGTPLASYTNEELAAIMYNWLKEGNDA